MKEHSLYRATKLYIEERPPEEIGNLKPRDIAKKFNVSISYLSRIFSKYCPITLRQYLEMYVMLNFHDIVNRMAGPNLKEVLARMKINDINYFIRRYKERYSHTPGSYCKRLREARKKENKK